MPGIIRAAPIQTAWTGKESMIMSHEGVREAGARPAVLLLRGIDSGPTPERVQALAAEMGTVTVLPPMYEREQPGVSYHTTTVADGAYSGTFHRTHIRQVKGFWEKFSFRPGNHGDTVIPAVKALG